MNDKDSVQKTALFISPHLDDVVFSCGGTLAKMSDEGWHTILCTVFTKSVLNPRGFALQCQLDKNLAPEVDYMKLRRAEDSTAARILNVADVLHLNFLEAPHRGYDSAAELFAGVKAGDQIWKSVAEHFALLDEIHEPKIIFAPQGLGDHCDHRQTIDAVLAAFDQKKINWYYDTPYAIRQPDARPYSRLPKALAAEKQNISAYLKIKIEACAAYQSQINFQFGGRANLESALSEFHRQPTAEQFAEKFLVSQTNAATNAK